MTSFFSSLKKETAPAPAISRFSSRISDKQPDKPLSARGKSPPPSARGSPPVTASIEERMATLRQKNPSGFQQISSPSRKVESQKTDDLEAVTAWQGDMDSIEQAQMQIQNDQMSLLHSQIHILTRELGDLQKHVVHLSTKIEDSLAEHAQTHSANLAELEAKVQGYNDEHNERHAQNSANLETSLQDVLETTHGKLQAELTELRHGGAGSLKDMGKILADVTEQVDKIDEALEKEHALRMAVEEKLDKMCEDLRGELQVAIEESHAALRLELAEVSGNADDIKSAMQEAHTALKQEFEAHKIDNDAMHRQAQVAISAVNDEHHEKHVENAQMMESNVHNLIGGTHAKLQEELQLLKAGGAASVADMQKILTDVTQQVDNLDQALQQEQELRLAVEARVDEMFTSQDRTINDLSRDMQVALRESHAALKVELAEHGKSAADIKAAMEDAQAAMKEETKLAHGSLKSEMQSLAKNNDAMHKRTLDELSRVHDEHTEKHAQNAERLEAGLDNVLGNTHAKLQEELKILKSGGVGSLKDLQKILTDVTKQVDNLDQAMEQEHELRMAVEQKVDSMFSDQEKTISDLRKDMKVALHESHAALKLELADHGKNAEDIRAAMEEANAALKEESKLAHGSLKNELQSLAKNNDAMHKKTQDELRKEMNSIHDEHTEKHAMNAEKLESGLQSVLGNTHAKLQDELKLLKSGGVGSLSDLQKIVTDLTQQVDDIDKAVEQEHQLRMAVEVKLDTMFSDQDKCIGALRKDMKVALNESHSALKLELAEHGKNAEEIKAAMEDAHKALKDEATLAHGSLKNELQSLAKNTDSMHQKSQDALRREMKAIHEEHSERHAQNAEKLESGLQNVLGNTHAKLQEELKLLKSGGVGSLSDVQKILTDVTQQVDNLDKAMQQEHDLRLAVEEKLDKMFSESDKNVGDLRKDMKVALHESHAALKLELAEHGKNAEGIKAAMEEANAALKDEAKLAHGSLKNELQSLSKAHESMHKKTKEELSREMQAIHEHHTQTHAQNAEKLESGLQNVLGNTHAKLQEELKLLKSGGVGSLKDLQKILVDVTQQVDNLDKAVQQEHELRMNVEDRLDGVVNDQKTAVSELRKDMKVALNESHAALKLELAEHGKNATAIQQAMLDAHKALQGETKLSHGSLKNELAALAKGNTSNHKRSMDDVTRNMQAMNNDHNEKHAVTAERLEAGLQSLRSAVFETQQAFKQDRTSREAQERTMMEFFQDARLQREQSEAGFQEQLRLERVAREVHVNQLKDVIAQRQGFTPNVEYTDLLLQERSSRESAHAIIERRLEAFDRSLSVERNERTTELQRLWEVFDGHTHETVSQVPPRPAARSPLPLSPRTSVRSVPYIETIPQSVVVTEALPVAAERMVSYTPGVETAVTPHTLTRSPLSARRMSAEMPVGLTYSGMPANPSPSPSAPLMMSLPTTGSVTSLPAAPSS